MIYRRVNDVIASEVAGETLLVPICDRLADMERVFALDEVPTFIWERLDGKHSSEEIAAKISAAFDVAPVEAVNDLEQFLEDLLAAKLIEPV